MFPVSLLYAVLVIGLFSGCASSYKEKISFLELKKTTDMYETETASPSAGMRSATEVQPSHMTNCCPCGQCFAGCKCGCSCETGLEGEKVCFERFDTASGKAFFTAQHDARRLEFPVTDPQKFQNRRPGECGRLTIQSRLMCTDFVSESGKTSKQESFPQQSQ